MEPVRQVADSRESPGTTRRGFYGAAIYALGGLITAALGLPALVYLFVPPKMRKQSDWVDAGDVRQLSLNSPVEMAFRRNRTDGWKVTSEKNTTWAVRLSNNEVVAYSPQCTHAGCPYHWDQAKNEFVCPCHNSVFSIDGKVQGGPAPRPLDRYQTKVEGNKLLIGPLQQSSGQTA